MKRFLVFLVLIASGLAIFVLGSPYFARFPTNRNQVYTIGLTAVFLIAWLLLRRSQTLSKCAPAAYALFTASAAILFLSTGILELRRGELSPLQDLALDKLSQMLHVVPVIVGLTLIARKRLSDIYIGAGNVKAGLTFGLISFVGFAALAFVLQAGSGQLPQLTPGALGLVLLWAFANSLMEELWFRAVFLKPYEAVVGRSAAILATSVVFGWSHAFATYDFPGGPVVFAAVVFLLGVVGAYTMSKTESVIGPVLFHAGYDLMIIVPVLASM
jgi:membrane protease YdiL (CAAX protease family)